MDQIAKYSSANKLIQNLKYEVGRGKKDGQGEVGDMFKKLSSWLEDRQTQFYSTLQSSALSMTEGLNELSKEISDLETKLSVITKERDDLLNIVNNLNGEFGQLSTKSPCLQSLKEPEENSGLNIQEVNHPDEGNLGTISKDARRPRISSEGADHEEHVDVMEGIDQKVQQLIQTPLADQDNFYDSDSGDVEYENVIYIKHSEQDGEVTDNEEEDDKENEVQNDNWPVDCNKCNLSLDSLDNFNQHMNDHWSEDKCRAASSATSSVQEGLEG